MIEFCAETYGWRPMETLEQPWAHTIQLLEARASRMDKAERESASSRKDGALVTYTDDLSEFGIGRG